MYKTEGRLKPKSRILEIPWPNLGLFGIIQKKKKKKGLELAFVGVWFSLCSLWVPRIGIYIAIKSSIRFVYIRSY